MKKLQGKSRFVWVGNQAAVDFINTQIVASGLPVDLWRSSQDVVRWLREATLIERGGAGAPEELLMQARLYRGCMREAIARMVTGARIPGRALAATNRYLKRGAAAPQLRLRGKEYALVVERQMKSAEDFLLPVAQAFAELATADCRRLRKCRNPECVLYFYDTSRNGRRAWCSLDTCGNKLRMAAMRARRSRGRKGQ